MNVIYTAVPTGTVNLRGSWSKFWQAIEGAYPGLGTALGIVGMVLVLAALLKWAWDRRRGGSMGQGAQPLWGALIPGAILAAPSILLPMLLTIVDWVANMGLAVIKVATGAA